MEQNKEYEKEKAESANTHSIIEGLIPKPSILFIERDWPNDPQPIYCGRKILAAPPAE